MRLQDKVILVTASTRGIGLAIVRKCAEEGARVYMAARNMEQAQKIANAMDTVKCVYNENHVCKAEHIGIVGGNADVSKNTECSTFECR